MNCYKDTHCATGGGQWIAHTQEHVTHSNEGTFLSRWMVYMDRIFVFLWGGGLLCLHVMLLIDLSLGRFPFTPSSTYFRSSVAEAAAGGSSIPPYLSLSGLLQDRVLCNDKGARKVSSLSLTRCSQKVYWFRSGLGDRKPSL